MVLENKLGITDSAELARQEEKISKKKALELFKNDILDSFEAGTFESFCKDRNSKGFSEKYLLTLLISSNMVLVFSKKVPKSAVRANKQEICINLSFCSTVLRW